MLTNTKEDYEDILFSEYLGHRGNLGIVTLNRPKALNALTQSMCRDLDEQLFEWERNDHIKAVIIQSNSERAFCAGGDIRRIYDIGRTGDLSIKHFFRDEYRLNHRIHHYPKPYISFINGINMGGGMGISIHGSHRVATENALFAMPETGIGFFPDIGGSYFLPRCPGFLGTFLGLIGARIKSADAIYTKLATHFISSNHIEACIKKIAETELPGDGKHTVSEILEGFAVEVGEAPLNQYRSLIDRVFAKNSIEEILEELIKQDSNEWCQEMVKLLKTKSPTSLKVTLKALRLGVKQNFDSCMKMEYLMAQHFLMNLDFYEGVRAVIIDKDQFPQWKPSHITEVTPEIVDQYFQENNCDALTYTDSYPLHDVLTLSDNEAGV